jgi:hypothetical protein
MKKDRPWKSYLFGLAIAAATLLAARYFVALGLRPSGEASVGQLFATLLVVAFVVERALEVFLTNLRAPRSEALREQILTLEAKIGSNPTPDLLATLEEAKTKLTTRKQCTRTLAMVLGLVSGIAISACGFRVLEPLVNTAAARDHTGQLLAFRMLDVLFSGGVIAGGSDGIHKLAEAYRNATTLFPPSKS